MTHPATEGVPLIIETPGGKEGHAADVARLKKLRRRPEAELARRRRSRQARRSRSELRAVPRLLLVGVALLPPGVAEVVVAALLPEAAAVGGHVLDAADPLGPLPGVQMRHDQPQREAVLGGEQLAVLVGGEDACARRRSRRAAGSS